MKEIAQNLLNEPRFSETEVVEKKLLPVSRVTLWRLRERREIDFLRIGGRVFYTASMLEKFLTGKYRKALA